MKAAIALLTLLLIAPQNGYDLFQRALVKERAEGNLEEAIQMYEQIIRDFSSDHALVARAQGAVAAARARLTTLESPGKGATASVATRQLFQGQDAVYAVSISPDGRYVPVPGDGYTLSLLDLTTGKKRDLTPNRTRDWNGEYADWAAFAPDGKQLAYAWLSKDLNAELRIIGVDGNGVRVLYRNEDAKNIAPFAWSPDGKQILTRIVKKDNTAGIALISTVDGSIRTVKTLDWRQPSQMNFSPDGRYIVYGFPESVGSENRDIFLLAVDGSRETPIVKDPADDVLLGWEPDGKRILFTSNRSGTVSAWTLEVDLGTLRSGVPQLVKADVGNIRPLGFTRKGSYSYLLDTRISDIFVAALDDLTKQVASNPMPLTQRFLRSNTAVDWTPDGKFLAFASQSISGPQQRVSTIVIHSMEDGSERELKPQLNAFFHLRWSPDGRSILLAGFDTKNRLGVHIVDAKTGEVTINRLGNYSGEWATDGKSIFYARQAEPELKHRPLMRFDLTTGEEKIIRLSVVGLAHAVSPDGKQIAFSELDLTSAVLSVMPATGGEPRELFRPKKPLDFGSIAWTPDGKYLYFVLRYYGADHKCELWRIAAAGGEPQRFNIALNEMSQLSIHPNGRHIAFNAGDRKSEIWVMDNFLPRTRTPGTISDRPKAR